MEASVVAIDEELDAGDQGSNASVRAATDRLLGDDVEPDLDLIEPRRVGRRVVDVEAWPRGE